MCPILANAISGRARRRPFLVLGVFVSTLGLAAAYLAPAALAQNRKEYSRVSADGGHAGLGLALRKLTVSGTFLQAPAHPDDETNALFTYFGYGQGLRVIDVQNNRGDSGQNEIGPELFRDLAVLRTAELLAAHRIDGAEQYFTRALQFHYSFSPEETIEKWGRKDIVGDYVRLWRMLRPDVIVTMNIQGRGGDRAHEAQTILVRESFPLAGDPSAYPEQLKEGLRPWQPKKLYYAGVEILPGGAQAPGADASKLTQVPTGEFDELLGRTYADIGSDAHSNHKCQGVGGAPPIAGLPGGRGGRGGRGGGRGGRGEVAGGDGAPAFVGRGGGGRGYSLVETSIPGQKQKQESSLFDGIDTRLTAIAQYAGQNPPAALTGALSDIYAKARLAQNLFADGDDAGVRAPVEAALDELRTLRAKLPSMGLSDSARYEVDFRLNLKERDYEDAVLEAHGLSFDALADDGVIIAGQPIRMGLSVTNHGPDDVTLTRVDFAGFDSPAACKTGDVRKGAAYACGSEAHIPENAKLTTPYFTDNYWVHPENQAIQILDPSVPFGVPFAPTPFRVTFHVKAGDVEVTKEIPVEFRYVKDIYFGDKRMELSVVPALSVRVQPELAVFPAASGAAKPAEREIHVVVTNGTKGAVDASVALELPAGWKSNPASAPIHFEHEDEALSARFQVTAPAQVKPGDYTLHAVATSPETGSRKFDSGYQVIEYPHIQRRQVIKAAEIPLKVIDVKTAPNLNVGYIVGVGDEVPPAIEQLGAKVSFIDENEMAWGDLSKHDVIVTGVRAYERRADLRAYNRRLLDYVERGGTVIVQYNKMEFNEAQYGPYPALVSQNRVTDRKTPVKVLVPSDAIFNFPNKLGPATWEGWVQERGLYFLGEKDSKYTDLISMTDSFKDNPGEKLGSLVEARYGKGRWVYVGLNLWRQLPDGTNGAYQILANLISLPRAPGGETAKKASGER